MKTLTVGTVGVALSEAIPGTTAWANIQGQAAAPSRPPAFAGAHKPKPLPYDPAKLKNLDAVMITNHHGKNYTGTVGKLNKIEENLASLTKDSAPFVRAGLKREQIIAANSVILHEHYFDNLGGDGKPAGKVVDAIKANWGTVEAWEVEFRGTGASLAGGSGWVVLTYSLIDGSLHNIWQADHSVNYALGRPLLAMDMYEHSYQRQFGPDVPSYVAAFMDNVNWEVVNKRFEQVAKITFGG
ncbi:MAG: superoxide dismutase [Blastocatellia bacterium]|nr:superoxide dismutase [Blastocatellia bacterium]